VLERRDFLLPERGADPDRAVAGKVQHAETALGAGLSAASAVGDRAAICNSSVAYGSLRAANCTKGFLMYTLSLALVQKVGLVTASEISRFRAKTMIYNKNELPLEFDRFRQLWVPVLLEKISVPLEKYKIVVRFASEDAYWKNWISGNLSAHEILLRINIHPRQFWYQGFPELLVIHEYCGHAVQMVNWHIRIENGSLPQFCGILTVHFPDQFVLEGLAESLAFILPGRQRLQARSLVSRELHRYYLIVMNNVHIIANEVNLKAAIDYASNRLPFTPTDVLSREVEDRTNNPLFRGYQYSYGIAKETFLNLVSNFSDQGRWDLLRLVYNWPMTPGQFQRTAEDLASTASRAVISSRREV
jgi:hypothetical protein